MIWPISKGGPLDIVSTSMLGLLDVLPISIRGPSRFQAGRLVVLSIFKGAPSGFEKGCPGCPFTFKEGLFERETLNLKAKNEIQNLKDNAAEPSAKNA